MSIASRHPLEEKLGLHFQSPALLLRALTHRSFLNENPDDPSDDNERLEFLGDAVIDFIVGDHLFRQFPTTREGELTAMRAALVRAETLAEFAQRLDLGHHLRLGVGEAESGGRERTATLCAAFEALTGAIYLDQGLTAVRPLLLDLVRKTLPHILDAGLHRDAKSQFQVWAQSVHGITPHYVVVETVGPDHARTFTVEARLAEAGWGRGQGRSKQAAAQEAAAVALAKVRQEEDLS